jgi:hypothetical protein
MNAKVLGAAVFGMLVSTAAWASGETVEINSVGYDVACNGFVITGAHLAGTGKRHAPQVTIGGRIARVVAYSPKVIVAEAPPGMEAGEYLVQVKTLAGTGAEVLFSLATRAWSEALAVASIPHAAP